MKKSFITALSIVISIVLICLISIQLYWINNAIELKEQQFEQSVQNALKTAVGNLEKEEAITQITKKINKREDLLSDSLQSNPELSLDSLLNNKAFSGKTSGGRQDSTELVIKKTRKQFLHTDENSKLNIRFPEKGDTLTRKQWMKKAFLVRKIVNELAFISISKDVKERVDLSVLNTHINKEFEQRGINTPYEFDILDNSENQLLLHENDKELKKKILQFGFQVPLFPNDYLIESDNLLVFFPDRKSYILREMWVMLSSSALLILLLIGAFTYIINTILKQKKLSEIKNDFISNMTHELKTPISTISLAAEALDDPELSRSEESRKNYLRMIGEENKRLGLMVENVLKSALWDKKDFKIKKEDVDVNSIAQEVCDSFSLRVKQKEGEIITDLKARPGVVKGDQVHLTNIIYNLLDNALKYTPESPLIKIKTENQKGFLKLSVEDNGIGMKKEVQKKIFQKFYRVPTGNIHNVKGFGLGLNYVKAIAEKHKGSVDVKSQPGKGSAFYVILPLKPSKSKRENQNA